MSSCYCNLSKRAWADIARGAMLVEVCDEDAVGSGVLDAADMVERHFTLKGVILIHRESVGNFVFGIRKNCRNLAPGELVLQAVHHSKKGHAAAKHHPAGSLEFMREFTHTRAAALTARDVPVRA